MASRMKVQYISSVIESAITSIDRAKDTDDISSLVLRLDYLNRVIVEVELPDSIVSSLGEVLSILREKEMEPDWEISSTDIEPIRRRGRPSFDVKEEQLSFLVENDFKVPEISLMLGVSTRTVERRLSSFGISISGKLEDFVDHVYFVHPSTDISADISTDCRPMYRSTYRSSIGRYVGRHIGRQSVDVSTEMCRSTYRPMYIGRVMVDISTDYRQISRSI